MNLAVVYATFPSSESAEAAGRALLEAGLVACVNLLPGVVSLYRWEGALQRDTEVVLIAKTTPDAAPAAVERVKALHPYQVPCVTWWRLDGAWDPYAAWVAAQVPEAR